MKKTIKIFFGLILSLLLVPIAYSVEPVKIGTMTSDELNWVFAQATCDGIYYGLGWNETKHYPPPNKIYYFDFATKENTLITETENIWSDSFYKVLVNDKLFMSGLANKDTYPFCDANGIYVLDLKTNSFYLYDRTPFNFCIENLISPMVAVGNDLYFFSNAERRVFKYNTITRESIALAELPDEIDYGGIVYSIEDKIYITTYRYGDENSLYVYDIQSNTFNFLIKDRLIPSNNVANSNVVIGDKLYFIGGEDAVDDWGWWGQSLRNIVEYNTLTNEFNIIGQFDQGMAGVAATVLGGAIYVLGGEDYDTNTLSQDIHEIVIDPNLKVSCSNDEDDDDVDDDNDACLETATAQVVDETGCSIPQYCPFQEYCPPGSDYKNHGKYVSCVAKTSERFLNEGLITEEEKNAFVSEAAKSISGKKKK